MNARIRRILGDRTGAEMWRGPSRADGEDVVVIATGLVPRGKMANQKTGDVYQVWILRADVSPIDAVRSGADRSICGDCPHRPAAGRKRTCYVEIRQAETVWRAWKRGRYAVASSIPVGDLEWILENRGGRFGAYGDPAVVPTDVWRFLASSSAMHVAYTHQWREPWCDPALREIAMCSVESDAEANAALVDGWRTFRVRPTPNAELTEDEVACPADPAVQKRSVCSGCGLCDGRRAPDDRRRNIAVVAHGRGQVSLRSRLQIVSAP